MVFELKIEGPTRPWTPDFNAKDGSSTSSRGHFLKGYQTIIQRGWWDFAGNEKIYRGLDHLKIINRAAPNAHYPRTPTTEWENLRTAISTEFLCHLVTTVRQMLILLGSSLDLHAVLRHKHTGQIWASRRLSAVLAMTVDLSQRFGVDGVTDFTTVATSGELAHFALLPLRLVVQNGAAIHLSIVGRLQLRGVTWVFWPAQNLPGTTSFTVYHSVSTVTTQILLKDICREQKTMAFQDLDLKDLYSINNYVIKLLRDSWGLEV